MQVRNLSAIAEEKFVFGWRAVEFFGGVPKVVTSKDRRSNVCDGIRFIVVMRLRERA